MRTGFLGAIVVAVALAFAPAAAGDVIFDEDFAGPATQEPFRIGGSFTPCLTASQATGQEPLPGCAAGQPSIPPGGDPDGSGALRLTDNGQRRTGYAIYGKALPLTAGLRFLLDAFAYNGTSVPGFPGRGADGISVFLKDAGTGGDAPGAFGGSLGYAQSNDDFDSPASAAATIAGVPGGYFGIGIDEFGNFANDREARGAGCGNRADRNLHPQTVSLRGRGQPGSEWLRGYCLLDSRPSPFPLDQVGATSRTAPGVARRYLIEVDPPGDPGARVRVYADFEPDGTFEELLDAGLPAEPPDSFEFGFAAATGVGTNIHELRAVRIETIDPLPLFTLSKFHLGALTAGRQGVFMLRVAVRGDGGPARAPLVLDDLLPPELTIAAEPSGEGWDCTATVVGGRRARCTFEASAQRPVPPDTVLPRVRLPVAVGAHVEGELVNRSRLSGVEIPTPLRATDRFRVRRAADLAVRKIARPESVAIGGLVSFAIAVTNHGPSDARGVVLDDRLPAGLSLVSAEASQGSCAASAQGVRCKLGTIEAGGTRLVAVIARATGPGGTLVNVAEVSGVDPDPDPSNNRDSARVEVPGDPQSQPDLTVEKRSSRGAVHVGEPFDYVVTVTNRGSGTARDVVLADGNSLRTRVLAMGPSQGSCRLSEAVVLCRLGNLAPGASATVRLRVKILEAGTARNSATALPDGASGSQIATADVKVRGGAVLRIRKVADRHSLLIGQRVHFRIRITSLGPQPAREVRVCDQLPPKLRLVRAPGSSGRDPICWAIASLGAGESRAFRLVAWATDATASTLNRAFADAANARRVHARQPVRVIDPCVVPVSAEEASISC